MGEVHALCMVVAAAGNWVTFCISRVSCSACNAMYVVLLCSPLWPEASRGQPPLLLLQKGRIRAGAAAEEAEALSWWHSRSLCVPWWWITSHMSVSQTGPALRCCFGSWSTWREPRWERFKCCETAEREGDILNPKEGLGVAVLFMYVYFHQWWIAYYGNSGVFTFK